MSVEVQIYSRKMDAHAVVEIHFELQAHNLCSVLALQISESVNQNLENTRHAKDLAAGPEESPSHGPNVRPQNHPKPLHLQNLRVRGLDERTLHIVGRKLPENQHALVL